MNSLVRVPSASRQVIANIIGRAWVLFSNFIFLPVYLYVLGSLNFGVVALFMAFTSLIAFLDLGLTPTLARELNDQRHNTEQRQNLLYTYELSFAAVLGLVTLIVGALPINAFEWLVSTSDFARPEIRETLRLIILSAVAQLLLNFYLSSMLGIEHQVKANVLLVTAGIVRSAFVILPLWIWPSPSVFLWWQLLATLGFALGARTVLYRLLSPTSKKCCLLVFDPKVLGQNWKFSCAVLLISVAASINTQIDKVFIGHLQGLEALSGYSLVITLAQLLVFGITPISLALTPRLVRIVSSHQLHAATELFELAHRFVAALVCAGMGFLIWFGPDLMTLWTVGKIKPEMVVSYLPMLVIGYGLLALQIVPHSLALAHKNMRGSILISGTIFLTVPAYWFGIERYGTQGAAAAWMVLQLFVFPLYFLWVIKSHTDIKRRLDLMLTTVLVPLTAAFFVSFFTSYLIGAPDETVRNFVVMVLSAMLCIGVCAMLTLRQSDRNLLLKILA